MTTQHPITPPPELLGKWEEDWHHAKVKDTDLEDHIAIQAARWGADQELEACFEWLGPRIGFATSAGLRATRRPKPKPPSKEEALDALYISFDRGYLKKEAAEIIRRALEKLDD